MQLRDAINNITYLPEEIMSEVLSTFREEVLPKRTILHEHNTICDKFYYIEKGLARLYYLKEGKDITGWFSVEGQFITANDSFFQRKPSHLNLELLEDSIIHSIHIDELNDLFRFKEMERFGRLLNYKLLSELSERVYSTLFQPAEKRYQLMMVRYPTVLQRAPLGDIASYLGISQETLSRIRAQQTNRRRTSLLQG